MAEKEKSQLFREKSLEGIESPEALNEYLRVTTPGVWIVLITIVVFLVGAVVYGIFGHISSQVSTAVISDGQETVCLVPAEILDGVLEYKKIHIDGQEYELAPSSLQAEMVKESTDVYVMLAGNLEIGDVVYQIPVKGEFDTGVYTGKVVKEEIRPISFLLKE